MITIPRDKIAEFCKRNHIRKLSIFGSVIKGTDTPLSDIDVIIEFQPGFVPGLKFFEIEEELSVIFGKRVDLNTPAFLSRYFRDKVMNEAVACYTE